MLVNTTTLPAHTAYDNLTTIHPFNSINGSATDNTTAALMFPVFGLTTTQKIIYYFAFAVLFVLGTFGNLVVIAFIYTKKAQRKSNFDVHIISLAVADLLSSIFLPLVMIHDLATNYQHWYLLGDFGCKLFMPMPHIFSLVSALMLAAISVERLLIIKRTKLTKRSQRKSICLVVMVWFLSIAIVSPYMYVNRVTNGACYDHWTNLERFIYYAVLQCFSCFVPIMIMAVVYTLSTIAIKKKRIPGEYGRLHVRRQKRVQKMTKMFGIIVVVFFVMTTPYLVSFFVAAYYGTFNEKKYLKNIHVLTNINYATYTLMAFNACIDPFIYSIRYKEMSKAFKNYLSSIRKPKQRYGVKNLLPNEKLYLTRNTDDFRKVSKESRESNF